MPAKKISREIMPKVPVARNWKEVDFESVYLPGIAVDTVIFGFHEEQLMVLLLKYENTNSYSLPGGFIKKEESLNDAASRVLKYRTGLSNIFLEQFYCFGDIARHDTSFFKTIMKAKGVEPTSNHFLLSRFISVGYYALVDFTKAVPTTDLLADECKWHPLKDLPPLIQDHSRIIKKALSALREDLDKKLVGFNLLPETFTMGELQSLYETILGTTFLRTSFQRKILSLEILERIEKKFTGAANKAPYLYKFKR